MENEVLNEVVERLFDDPRFLRRFRRNPERALRGYRLHPREIEALKSGNTHELLALGLRPATVWPELRPATPSFAGWLLQSKRALAPAMLLLALAAAAPAQAAAPRSAPGRFVRRRVARLVRSRDVGRYRGRAMRRIVRRAGLRRADRVRGRARALVRVSDAV